MRQKRMKKWIQKSLNWIKTNISECATPFVDGPMKNRTVFIVSLVVESEKHGKSGDLKNEDGQSREK